MTDAVSRDVAESEFERFCEAMALDVSSTNLDAESRGELEKLCRTMVDAICSGALVIDAEGRAVYTPRLGDTSSITFEEPTGASLMAQDQHKAGKNITRLFSVMADMTGQSTVRFAKMKGRDLKVCTAIATLFLAQI